MRKKKVSPPKPPKLKAVVPGKVGRPKLPVGLGDALSGAGTTGPPPMAGPTPMMKRGGKVKRK